MVRGRRRRRIFLCMLERVYFCCYCTGMMMSGNPSLGFGVWVSDYGDDI